MSDTRTAPPTATATGFSTRAIRAASRAPKVDQTPTSVPIYQTATFASADADELGRVVGRRSRRLRLQPHLQPDDGAPSGAAYAELAGGEAGRRPRLGDGRDPRRPRLTRPRRRPDRRPARGVRLDPDRSCSRTFGGFGVQVELVDTTDLDAVAAALAAAPTRVLYAETIANPTTARRPTTPPSPSWPIATARRTSSTTRSPRRTSAGRSSSGRTSSSSRRPSSSAATATSSPAWWPDRRDLIADGRAGPDRYRRHPRPVRCLPRPARDPDPRHPGRAPRGDGRGTGRLARASGRRARRPLPGPARATPSTRSRSASSGRGVAGGMLAFEVAGGRAAGRAIIDALTLPELTASLGSVHTMVVHPPSTSHRQSTEAELLAAGHHARACSACRSGSRTSRTCRPTSRPPSPPPATLDARPVPALGAV